MREQTQMTKAEAARVPEAVEQVPTVVPLVDIYENQEEILLIADFPGVKPEDVNVKLEKDELLLEGARRDHKSIEGALTMSEYRDVSFRRAFVVPRGIDPSKLEAKLKNGVLTLRLPKSDSLKPRQIKVTAS